MCLEEGLLHASVKGSTTGIKAILLMSVMDKL
jgi:hypothetical protein